MLNFNLIPTTSYHWRPQCVLFDSFVAISVVFTRKRILRKKYLSEEIWACNPTTDITSHDDGLWWKQKEKRRRRQEKLKEKESRETVGIKWLVKAWRAAAASGQVTIERTNIFRCYVLLKMYIKDLTCEQDASLAPRGMSGRVSGRHIALDTPSGCHNALSFISQDLEFDDVNKTVSLLRRLLISNTTFDIVTPGTFTPRPFSTCEHPKQILSLAHPRFSFVSWLLPA